MLANIVISTPPTKTTYTAGQVFDPTGMVVTATFEDGTSKAVTGYTYEPADALETTDTEITVSYGGKTATQAVTVLSGDVSLASVTVDSVSAVKGEDDNWTVELPAGTTSVEEIEAVATDADATITSITPDAFETVEAGQEYVSTIVVTAEDGVTTGTYTLTITVATE